MNKKRFLAAFLSSLMTISSAVTPFLSLPVSAADNLNSFTENGTSDIPISCEVNSGYTVSLPASIALSNNTAKDGYNVGQTYKAGVSGNIASDKYVIVTPTNLSNFTLSDTTGDRIVNPVISQPDVSWSADELGTGSEMVNKDGDIFAQIDLAGSYSGEAQFEFYLSDKEIPGIGESNTLEAGLYDVNGNMLCTWEESGIDVETDYTSSTYSTSTTSPYYVLTNNYPMATKVVIPSSVTSIGNYAFYTYTGLTSIEIPSSVTRIGDYAFKSCTGLTSVTIPDSVTRIGGYVFQNCTSLTNAIIGNGITNTGHFTFEGCAYLINVTISDSVIGIGTCSFRGTGLTSITIPDSVTSIGSSAFSKCTGLTSVTFKTTTGWYVGSSPFAKTTALSDTDLANTSTAATYLKTTYYDKYWTRD